MPGLSQVPGAPTFRSESCNAIAVVPLLSSDDGSSSSSSTINNKNNVQKNPHTQRSYEDLFGSLNRYCQQQQEKQREQHSGQEVVAPVGEVVVDNKNNTSYQQNDDDLLVVVPCQNLSKPGDWRYDNTPLKHFSFSHGCLRLQVFDGRPDRSRMAHDRLLNHQLREYIDLEPSRRTAAVVGVLNIRDCPDVATLKRAELELERWAERYATPPYSVTAHGRDYERDHVVKRLYVFDSFHETSAIKDLSQSASLATGSSLVAFPPSEMLDLHVSNVVLNDLAVAIFRSLELKIQQSDALTQGTDGAPNSGNKSRFFGSGSITSSLSSAASSVSDKDKTEPDSPQGSADGPVSINNLAAVVSPNSKLAPVSSKTTVESTKKRSMSIATKLKNVSSKKGASSEAQLLTPLDEFWDYSELAPKDAHEMMKREIARREKYAADLSLLAGSPLDAYDRYTKAADLCKTSCPDPLWFASAVIGIASAHVAMAECGGFEVDSYLEASFQLPDDLMSCAVLPAEKEKRTYKQNMPAVIFALCEDALDITSRNPKLACFHAELLLKLAWYVAEVEDVHLRCQWGLGEGCFGGDGDRSSSALNVGGSSSAGDYSTDKRRWEMASATHLNFLDWKNKDGEDVIQHNTLKRCQKWTEFMHSAASTGALDAVTRTDVALRCAALCVKGLRPSSKPTIRQRPTERVILQRKASFFVTVAAEAMSDVNFDTPDKRAASIWLYGSRMLSSNANTLTAGNYGWATLRAIALHSLVLLGIPELSEEAAITLLSLMSAIKPRPQLVDKNGPSLDDFHAANRVSSPDAMDSSGRGSDGYVDTATYIADARSYIKDARRAIAKDARARSKELFSSQNAPSSSLAVAQSKWVDDDPITPELVPLSDFTSDFSNRVLALNAVWSTIRLDRCSTAQTKLLGQITDMRKASATSSLLTASASRHLSSSTLSKLPVKLRSIQIVEPSPAGKLEKVKRKAAPTGDKANPAMATFFNPYADKNKNQVKTALIPVGEEQYISVSFQNKLSISLEIASCKLDFNTQSDLIKAPAISFTIPPQTDDFKVQFPFLLLDIPRLENSVLLVTGLHVTALSRSRYYAIENPQSEEMPKTVDEDDEIPPSASLYPRRKYDGGPKDLQCKAIKSPCIEIVPPQPSLQVAFARSRTPIEEDMIIPVPLMDGEIFHLPKLCLFNDPCMANLGMIEELRITAHGLPGLSEVVLYDLSKSSTSQTGEHKDRLSQETSQPILMTATCSGMDKASINGSSKSTKSSYISICLTASPDMGGTTDGCNVTLRFRYRGPTPTETTEVWRSREIQIGILRMKGPRISSLAFRPDLSWESGYTELCKTLASDPNRPPQSSVNVCSKKIAVLVMVANEAQFPIVVSGFDSHTMKSLRVPANVSIRVPITLSKLDKGLDMMDQLIEKTRLSWIADSGTGESVEDTKIDTGGPMIALNQRKNRGFMEPPMHCIENIIEENPMFMSRICDPPCTLSVQVDKQSAMIGKPVKVTVNVVLKNWAKTSNATLQFCCARKESEKGTDENWPVLSNNVRRGDNDFIWAGYTCKSLKNATMVTKGEESSSCSSSASSSSSSKLVFLNPGQFIVSACVVLDSDQSWLAEEAVLVDVSTN